MDFYFDNIKVAQADIPESFETKANIDYRWQHDIVPFTHSVQAVDRNENIIMYSWEYSFSLIVIYIFT